MSSNVYLEYLQNPFICALIISIGTYYVYSSNYMDKQNIRDRFPLRVQRTMNIKSCLYIFLLSVVILFVFRYASSEGYGGIPRKDMIGGYPPF